MGLLNKVYNLFKIKESLNDIPTLEINPEKEEQLLKEILKKIRKYKLKNTALLFLRSYKPLNVYGAKVAPVIFSPYFFLLDFFQIDGYYYNAFFMKKENLEKLIKRIEEL